MCLQHFNQALDVSLSLCMCSYNKSICCAGGLCGAVALKFWRSGQCGKKIQGATLRKRP